MKLKFNHTDAVNKLRLHVDDDPTSVDDGKVSYRQFKGSINNGVITFDLDEYGFVEASDLMARLYGLEIEFQVMN